jgi:hypothetical protein
MTMATRSPQGKSATNPGPSSHRSPQLEQLTEPSGLLFPAAIDGFVTPAGRNPGWRGGALIPNTAAGRIERFIEIANELAREHCRDHELVPDDPAGMIVLSRFRQTIGWFINRLPGGRVALGIQYGHLQSQRVSLEDARQNGGLATLYSSTTAPYQGRRIEWTWGHGLRAGDVVSLDWSDDGGPTGTTATPRWPAGTPALRRRQ